MDSGIETTARSATEICRLGAKAWWPPAPSDRRSATGAPGEIAISTTPIAASRGSSSSRVTASASAGTAIRTAKRPRTIVPGRCQIHRSSPGAMLRPMLNITVNTVTTADAVTTHSGIGPLIVQPLRFARP